MEKLDIEKAIDVRPAGLKHPLLEVGEVSRHVRRADNSAHGSSTNDTRFNAFAEQRVDHADVRPAARCAGSEGQAYSG